MEFCLFFKDLLAISAKVEVDQHLADLQEDGSLAKAWGQFKTARVKAGGEVTQSWDATSQIQIRNGQDRAKRKQLLAGVVDPQFKNAYSDVSRGIIKDKDKKKQMTGSRRNSYVIATAMKKLTSSSKVTCWLRSRILTIRLVAYIK